MREVILSILQSYDFLQNITSVESTSEDYLHEFKFVIQCNTIAFNISLKIPFGWESKLFKFSVENYKELPFMPHIGENGSICLFELEGLLLGLSLSKSISECISKLYKLLLECSSNTNSYDLITEFESYWMLLPKINVMKSVIDINSDNKEIYFFEKTPNNEKFQNNKKNKAKRVISETNQGNRYVSDKEGIPFLQRMYQVKGQKTIGAFIMVNLDEPLLPPDWRSDLDIDYVNQLVQTGLRNSPLSKSIPKSKNTYTIVFKIIQPTNDSVLIGVSLRNVTFDAVNLKFIPSKQSKIVPYSVVRADLDYLIERGGSYKKYSNLDVLVIGCGSIGGYLISNLLKSGIRNITVVDNDILSESNVFRHLLGMQYVGKNKAAASKEFFQRNIPYANITAIQETFEEGYNRTLFDIDDFQLVVSAVGNHNFNIWLNKLMHKEALEVPVVYLWNEVLGVGSHAFFVSKNYRGCYECIIDNQEVIRYDRSSYCQPGQKFSRQVQGCGSFYLPYNSLTSIRSANIGTELILRWCDGMINENVLVSEKGDSSSFLSEGYKLSDRYILQEELRGITYGNHIYREDCYICKKK